MTALDERFRSRFEWGLTADIQPPDYETKVAILRKYAETTFNIKIPEEINQYIANNIKSSIRDLEGAVKKIVFLAKLNHVDTANITMEIAEEALKDKIDPNNEVTPKLILDVVAEHFGIKPEDITSQRRNSEFVNPRQIFMYLCRKLTDTSYTNIAKLLNKNDHTTVIHGCRKIEEALSTDKELQNKIQIIEKKIIPS